MDSGEFWWDQVSALHSDGLRVELLQLATLLVRKRTEHLTGYRKELIKFGWNHLKRDPPLPKNQASHRTKSYRIVSIRTDARRSVAIHAGAH